MRSSLLFKTSFDARMAACGDRDCYIQGGYIVKKFQDGYRYFPVGIKANYVKKSPKLLELGQHVLKCYW